MCINAYISQARLASKHPLRLINEVEYMKLTLHKIKMCWGVHSIENVLVFSAPPPTPFCLCNDKLKTMCNSKFNKNVAHISALNSFDQ